MAVSKKLEKEALARPQQGTDELVKKLENFLLSLAAKTGQKLPELWVKTVFHPEEVFSEAKGGSLLDGAVNILAATALPIIVFSIAITGMLFGLGIVYAAIFLLLSPLIIIFSLLAWLASSAITFWIGKFLGGQGSFKRFAYLSSLASAGVGILLSLSMVPMALPLLGLCYSQLFNHILSGALLFYLLYLDYLAVRKVLSLPSDKAAAAVILTVFVEMLICALLVIALYALYFLGIFAMIAASSR